LRSVRLLRSPARRAAEKETDLITTIEHGAVRELRLARPPANALSPELIAALTAAFAEAAAPSPAAQRAGGPPAALVLSGAPGMFSGGLDLPTLLSVDRASPRRRCRWWRRSPATARQAARCWRSIAICG
jgi:enoyl-CoA hydratase/carnithine racemase